MPAHVALVIDAAAAGALTPWRIKGSYFESCNCEAICPCRMVSGVKGGRSTYGICFGVLSWLVEEGHAGEVDLTGLAAAFVVRYDDDEPRSPWSFIVHVDERGSLEQRQALAAILTGELGGEAVLRLPWVSKPSELIDVARARSRSRTAPRGTSSGSASAVTLSASRPFETDQVVACGIPGYDFPGTELLADELVVDERPVRVGADRQLRLREPVRLLRRSSEAPFYAVAAVAAVRARPAARSARRARRRRPAPGRGSARRRRRCRRPARRARRPGRDRRCRPAAAARRSGPSRRAGGSAAPRPAACRRGSGADGRPCSRARSSRARCPPRARPAAAPPSRARRSAPRGRRRARSPGVRRSTAGGGCRRAARAAGTPRACRPTPAGPVVDPGSANACWSIGRSKLDVVRDEDRVTEQAAELAGESANGGAAATSAAAIPCTAVASAGIGAARLARAARSARSRLRPDRGAGAPARRSRPPRYPCPVVSQSNTAYPAAPALACGRARSRGGRPERPDARSEEIEDELNGHVSRMSCASDGSLTPGRERAVRRPGRLPHPRDRACRDAADDKESATTDSELVETVIAHLTWMPWDASNQP